jgi:hypothetical protein
MQTTIFIIFDVVFRNKYIVSEMGPLVLIIFFIGSLVSHKKSIVSKNHEMNVFFKFSFDSNLNAILGKFDEAIAIICRRNHTETCAMLCHAFNAIFCLQSGGTQISHDINTRAISTNVKRRGGSNNKKMGIYEERKEPRPSSSFEKAPTYQ